MDSTKLNDWLQVVGLFGIIGSLIFVGLQMKQDRQIALAEVITSAAESSKYWAELVNSNADLWVKGLKNEDLTEVELQRFQALADAFFFRWQAAWTRASQLEPSLRNRFAKEAALHIHRNPGLQSYWARRLEWIAAIHAGTSEKSRDPFTATVEEQLSLLSSDSSDAN